MSNAQPTVSVGDILGEVETEILEFTPLGIGEKGPTKVQLLPSPWSADDLPPASATLLSVASKRGLVAAASPDKLVVASTDKIRKAFKNKVDVVTDFSPDVTLPVPRLRHVAFSSDEDFLVISAESGGGLAVYAVDELLKGNTQPGNQVATNNTPVRVLSPNPANATAHYVAAVLDSGRLDLIDVSKGQTKTVRNEGVTCVSWSVKGKAFVAGLSDGTAAIHLVDSLERIKGTIPKPPEIDESDSVSSVYWLSNEEFLIGHSPEGDGEARFHFVSANKDYSSFTFRETPMSLAWNGLDGLTRKPPFRFSIQRLRKWDPSLDDMLIVTGANSIDVSIVTKTSEPIDTNVPEVNEYQLAGLLDNRKVTIPRNLAEDGDSALVGEAIDLGSKEKVEQPSRRLDEITESPTPLPAYYVLTHEGLLAAWWVVWDKSLEAKTAYSSLTYLDSDASSSVLATPKPQPTNAPSSAFGQNSTTPSLPFGAARPFGMSSKPSTPAFGTPSFPTTSGQQGGSMFGKPSQLSSFGTPGLPGASASGAKPGGSVFGSTGTLGARGSTFGTPSQTPAKSNPFMKYTAEAAAGSTPSSFASNKDGQSGFGSLGQKPSSGFASANGAQSGFASLGSKPAMSSFGSTVTVDSQSGLGSTVPSLANTPALRGGSLFGSRENSSFQSTTSTQSGSSGFSFGDRGRDEATPTPQNPPQQTSNIFGGGQKFTLGSTFKPDGAAKDDAPKPAASSGSSFFGNNFSSSLAGTISKPPETPVKFGGSEKPKLPSTTPAAPPPSNGFFSAAPKAIPEEKSVPEDAPLPPDWRPTKPSKTEDEVPPLAGSPPVAIEAPSSDVSEPPLDDDDDGDLSEEEAEEGDEEEEESEDVSDEQTGDEGTEQSVSASEAQSPQEPIPPAAPTPPQTTQPRAPSRTSMPSQLSAPAFGGTRREPMNTFTQPPLKPPTPQPVFSDLTDDEDERIRQELESEIEPSRTLAPFVARQEYAEKANKKTGHAAQIEIVYRDINSMVDTLGLNSRSLKAFIEYHERSQRYTELTRSALEEVTDQGVDGIWFENWSLSEIEDLKNLEDQIEQEMDEGRSKNILDKVSRLGRLIHESAKLLSKVNEERRRIVSSRDPEKLEANRRAPLPKELADQQKALRREYAQLLTLMGKAEDAILLLRSKLASQSAQNGRTGAVPSVEAIKKTINKLMDITKEKNHDITLLEAQLRKVGLTDSSRPTSSSSRHTATPLRRSRAARNESPFATPPTTRSKMSLMELNRVAMTPEPDTTPSRGYGLFFTPEGSPSSRQDLSTLADIVDDDLDNLRDMARQRRNVAASLASALANRGIKRTTVASEDGGK